MSGDQKDVPAQMPIRRGWLRTGREAAIEPELPIVDTHHHIWDPPGARYLLDDFLADAGEGHNIRSSVFIECHSMYRSTGPSELHAVGETEFAAGVAAMSESGRYGDVRVGSAIIACVDYALGAKFAEIIDAHRAAAGGRLRGFRGRVSSHPDPTINKWTTPSDILLSSTAQAAMAAIAGNGLSLDIWAYQTQHDDLLAACRKLPDLSVVVDHAAGVMGCGPYHGKRGEFFEPWASGVRRLAELPNTTLKFSGMGMRFAGFDYDRLPVPPGSSQLADDWRSYFDVCLEAFGPNRIMFASNFPADKGSYGYNTVWNAFKRLSTDLTADERSFLFEKTAQRVYRID